MVPLNLIKNRQTGFTLLEVLLALSVLAVALTALLKATASGIVSTQKIREKTMAHDVALNALSKIQMKLLPLSSGQEITKEMKMFDRTWYWHARISSTPLKGVERITITVSPTAHAPSTHALIGFQAKS